MSENSSRWDVGYSYNWSEAWPSFSFALLELVNSADVNTDMIDKDKLHSSEAGDILDFIIELVHEIERLQTENLRLADVDKHRAQLEHSVIKLAGISKPQPFHMWVE